MLWVADSLEMSRTTTTKTVTIKTASLPLLVLGGRELGGLALAVLAAAGAGIGIVAGGGGGGGGGGAGGGAVGGAACVGGIEPPPLETCGVLCVLCDFISFLSPLWNFATQSVPQRTVFVKKVFGLYHEDCRAGGETPKSSVAVYGASWPAPP